jgi:hypothetical protein
VARKLPPRQLIAVYAPKRAFLTVQFRLGSLRCVVLEQDTAVKPSAGDGNYYRSERGTVLPKIISAFIAENTIEVLGWRKASSNV